MPDNTIQINREDFLRIENMTHDTAKAVHELVPIVRQNAQTVNQTSQDVNNLSTKVAEISQPKGISAGLLIGIISTFIGFGTLLLSFVIAVGGLAFVPVYQSQTRYEKQIEVLTAKFFDHIKDGHPGRVEEKITCLKTMLELEKAHIRELIDADKKVDHETIERLEKEIELHMKRLEDRNFINGLRIDSDQYIPYKLPGQD